MTLTTETKILGGMLIVTIAIIVGGAFIMGRSQGAAEGEPVSQPERLVRDSSPAIGAADAKVTVVEFGDFQCPACGLLHPFLKQVKAANQDKSVRFVFRQFPLVQTHEHAQLAAEATLAAHAQGKFWELHDRLFENQSQLTRDDLMKHAEAVGLDVARFTRELDDHTYRDAVQQDVADGTAIRVQGTPSIYINGVKYAGSYSPTELQAAIDQALTQ